MAMTELAPAFVSTCNSIESHFLPYLLQIEMFRRNPRLRLIL